MLLSFSPGGRTDCQAPGRQCPRAPGSTWRPSQLDTLLHLRGEWDSGKSGGAPRVPVRVGGYRAGPSGAPSLVPRGLGGLERGLVMRGRDRGRGAGSQRGLPNGILEAIAESLQLAGWGQGCAPGKLWVLACLADFLPQDSHELAGQDSYGRRAPLWASLHAVGAHICL